MKVCQDKEWKGKFHKKCELVVNPDGLGKNWTDRQDMDYSKQRRMNSEPWKGFKPRKAGA